VAYNMECMVKTLEEISISLPPVVNVGARKVTQDETRINRLFSQF
jgi:hypothetical protein